MKRVLEIRGGQLWLPRSPSLCLNRV